MADLLPSTCRLGWRVCSVTCRRAYADTGVALVDAVIHVTGFDAIPKVRSVLDRPKGRARRPGLPPAGGKAFCLLRIDRRPTRDRGGPALRAHSDERDRLHRRSWPV